MVACGGGGGSGSGSDDEDAAVDTASLLVRWQAAERADGYVIHWGTASGIYDHELDVGAPLNGTDDVVSFLLDGVASPSTIYLALTSYDATGRMSGFSNELATIVP